MAEKVGTKKKKQDREEKKEPYSFCFLCACEDKAENNNTPHTAKRRKRREEKISVREGIERRERERKLKTDKSNKPVNMSLLTSAYLIKSTKGNEKNPGKFQGRLKGREKESRGLFLSVSLKPIHSHRSPSLPPSLPFSLMRTTPEESYSNP